MQELPIYSIILLILKIISRIQISTLLELNQYVQGYSMLRCGNHAEGILVEGSEKLLILLKTLGEIL